MSRDPALTATGRTARCRFCDSICPIMLRQGEDVITSHPNRLEQGKFCEEAAPRYDRENKLYIL